MDGADLVIALSGPVAFRIRGRSVEHISHVRMEGWLRNVQVGHAMALGRRPELGPEVGGMGMEGVDLEKAVWRDDEGSDVDRDEDEGSELPLLGTESRGIPHSLHIRAAAGLFPGGFRSWQIPHSQLSKGS